MRKYSQNVKFGGLLAVGQGSVRPPRLIVLEHRGGPKSEAPVALVGKAITFDTGGISIKPAANMEEMIFDKCGGIAVLGAMAAIAALGVKRNVVGVIASAENMPGGNAYRPGDIITTYDGKHIEIVNTDAEGRVVLADAIAYARRDLSSRRHRRSRHPHRRLRRRPRRIRRRFLEQRRPTQGPRPNRRRNRRGTPLAHADVRRLRNETRSKATSPSSRIRADASAAPAPAPLSSRPSPRIRPGRISTSPSPATGKRIAPTSPAAPPVSASAPWSNSSRAGSSQLGTFHFNPRRDVLPSGMKFALLLILAAGPLLAFAGCADESTPIKGDRLGARAGVAITSQDMSRVAPTRAELVPPAN